MDHFVVNVSEIWEMLSMLFLLLFYRCNLFINIVLSARFFCFFDF